MTYSDNRNDVFDRRKFLGAAAAITASSVLGQGSKALAEPTAAESNFALTGNGTWTYRKATNWGQLPEGVTFGGTHGAIATDNAGLVYISTQSSTGVLVYNQDGNLLKHIATEFPEVHSMLHATESGEEYFYTVVQKGTPQQNWLFLKLRTDGTVVQKITAPAEAGFHAQNEWRITSAVPGPDGSIFIANGYGDSRIFKFDKNGEYKKSLAGKGTTDGLCNCCHSLAVDTRYDQPLLLVCDRENRRLTHFDFDGHFVGNVAQHLRRPCQVSFHGDYAVVSELEGRVTILDKDNVPVAFLGDNPDKIQWANYKLNPSDIEAPLFSAAHGCHIDAAANIYISDWNQTGRITKLLRWTR